MFRRFLRMAAHAPVNAQPAAALERWPAFRINHFHRDGPFPGSSSLQRVNVNPGLGEKRSPGSATMERVATRPESLCHRRAGRGVLLVRRCHAVVGRDRLPLVRSPGVWELRARLPEDIWNKQIGPCRRAGQIGPLAEGRGAHDGGGGDGDGTGVKESARRLRAGAVGRVINHCPFSRRRKGQSGTPIHKTRQDDRTPPRRFARPRSLALEVMGKVAAPRWRPGLRRRQHKEKQGPKTAWLLAVIGSDAIWPAADSSRPPWRPAGPRRCESSPDRPWSRSLLAAGLM